MRSRTSPSTAVTPRGSGRSDPEARARRTAHPSAGCSTAGLLGRTAGRDFHDVLADAILDWRNRQIPARLAREKLGPKNRSRRPKSEHAEIAGGRSSCSRCSRSSLWLASSPTILALRHGGPQYCPVASARRRRSRQPHSQPRTEHAARAHRVAQSRTSQAEEALRKALPLVQLRRTLVPGAGVHRRRLQSQRATDRDGRKRRDRKDLGTPPVIASSRH